MPAVPTDGAPCHHGQDGDSRGVVAQLVDVEGNAARRPSHTYLAQGLTVIMKAVPPGRDGAIALSASLTSASISNADTSGV